MCDEISKYGMKIMIADVNGKVGRKDLYRATVEHGKFLIDFAKEKNMFTVSRYCQRKGIYKNIPDGKSRIHHFIIGSLEQTWFKHYRTLEWDGKRKKEEKSIWLKNKEE